MRYLLFFSVLFSTGKFAQQNVNTALGVCTAADYTMHALQTTGTADATMASTGYNVDVIMEVDSGYCATYYHNAGISPDTNAVIKYIKAVFFKVDSIYEKELNVRLNLSQIIIDKSDLYHADGYASYAICQLVQDNWNKNHTGVKRNIVHFMTSTTKAYGTGGFGYSSYYIGNVTYQGTLCNNAESYSVSGPRCFGLSDYYDVYILAHELGHNFGALHTHSCVYGGVALDTCFCKKPGDTYYIADGCDSVTASKGNPGCIMSYCPARQDMVGKHLNISLIPKVGGQPNYSVVNVMKQTVLSSASCLTTFQSVAAVPTPLHHVRLSPNPTAGLVQLDAGMGEITKILVYDVLGHKLKEMNTRGSRLNMDLSSLQNGIYLLEIYSGAERTTERVVVAR